MDAYKQYWIKESKRTQRYENKLKRILAKEFELIGNEVLKGEKRQHGELTAQFTFNVEQAILRAKQRTNGTFSALIESSMKEVARTTGTEFNREELSFLIRKIRENSSNRIGGSVKTLDKNIKEDIQRVIRNSATRDPSELSKLIREGVGEKFQGYYTKERVDMIAQTTTTQTNSSAKQNFAKKKGVSKKRWIRDYSSNTRDTHKAVNGTTIGINEMFNVGRDTMLAPGLGSLPEEIIYCRCDVIYKK